MGIKTGDIIYIAKNKCPSLKIYPPNYKFYSEMSKKMFDYLYSLTPDIEIASIDECYIDYGKIKKLYGDEFIFAKKINKEKLIQIIKKENKNKEEELQKEIKRNGYKNNK